MASSGYPNRIRAYTALLIYRDAMRRYIADILEQGHGEAWFDKDVLEPLSQRPGKAAKDSHEAINDALQRGAERHLLIEHGTIAFLIRDHLNLFNGLRRSDVDRLHQIRSVRNEFLEHDFEEGDCGPEVADAITSQCILVLDRCGLADAAEEIRGLSRTTADTLAPTQAGSTDATPSTAVSERGESSKARRTGEQSLCVCGCGFGTKSLFKPGHDGRLVRIIRRGTAAERASVDWQRVPLTFHNGDYADEIRHYQSSSSSGSAR